MKREFSAMVMFRSPDHGGRQSGPPTGPIYYATATAAPEEQAGLSVKSRPEWEDFSIVLSFEESPYVNMWHPVKVWALVSGALGSESLRLRVKLFVLEGPHPVAELRINDGQTS